MNIFHAFNTYNFSTNMLFNHSLDDAMDVTPDNHVMMDVDMPSEYMDVDYMNGSINVEDLAFRLCVDLNNLTPISTFMTHSEYIQKLRNNRPLTLAEFNILIDCSYFTTIREKCIEQNFDDFSKQYLPEKCYFDDCKCHRHYFFSNEK